MFSVCSLEETPIDQIPEEEAYKTPEMVYINAVAGLYNELRSIIGTDHNLWDMNNTTTDEMMLPTRGSDWDDGGLWRSMHRHQWTPAVGMFNNAWSDRFTAIGKCNQNLKVVEQSKANNPDATFYDTYIAEIRAIRALSYFYLLDNFGRVPIVVSADTPIDEIKQSARSEVFKFVKEELQEVLPMLPNAQSSALGTYYGRITRGTVHFLLAKLAINAQVYNDDNWETTGNAPAGSTDFTINGENVGAWNATIAYCDSLRQGGYQLQSSFSSNFAVMNEGSEENIFVIPMDPSTYRVTNFNNSVRTLHYVHGNAFGMSTWNGACTTIECMQVFGFGTADEDPRLDMSFYTGKVTGPDGNYIINPENGEDFEYLPMTARLEITGSDADRRAGARWKKFEIDRQFQGSGEIVYNDFPLFRYADVLLMEAEAYMRLSNSTQALALVNEVRERVGAKLLTGIDLATIEKERILELSWENWRRNDMVRFGTFTRAYTDKEVSQPYRIVFPIPENVLASNQSLTQNPGY
ncbi:MAG: RagB/SusD family nutrient uptake outer membrane protein [Tannerellaceae bacterium]|nr:RagB/SusD family nutrient uptake outer membrane protein [Tannerellaceae bacterium]